jgi:hypothetical protein
MVDRANCVITLRSEGVSLVLDISNGQLPAILHWGADLGALELADAEALILSHIDPGAPNVVDGPIRLAILPEHAGVRRRHGRQHASRSCDPSPRGGARLIQGGSQAGGKR